LLCVLEQPRIDNSSAGSNWSNWFIAGPEYCVKNSWKIPKG
jgi:hypothetical protein